MGRHVVPLGHIILIMSQPVFVYSLALYEKQQIPILWSLVKPDQGFNPQSTPLEVSMLTITIPMWFLKLVEAFYLVYILICMSG